MEFTPWPDKVRWGRLEILLSNVVALSLSVMHLKWQLGIHKTYSPLDCRRIATNEKQGSSSLKREELSSKVTKCR